METKIINMVVPSIWEVPEEINIFTPEEIAFILDVGCETIKDARKLVAGLSQKEIYNKIRDETNKEIQKLEIDLLVQKELRFKMEEALTVRYDTQLNELKKKNEELTNKLKEIMNNSLSLVQQEIEKEKEKCRIMLEEKNKQVLRFTENYEKILQQTNMKTSKKLGDEGEENFLMLSETFKDFVGYKIEKKSHQAHKGDFHLFFENFNVLVDLKNYSGSVQKKELEKIEHDLSINSTMDYAWLISYESNVCDWNRFPIMCKWIITDIGLKCIIIVNKLNSNKNPMDTLRIVWNMTNEIHIIMNKIKETKSKEMNDDEIIKIRERDFNILQKIKMTQKRLSEMKRNIASMSQIAKDMENDLIDAISMFTNELSKNEYDKTLKIHEWWYNNIEFDDNAENKLISTDIWFRFKKDNKTIVEENNISIDDLKEYIKNYVDINNYIEKSKKGSIELNGFKFIETIKSDSIKSDSIKDDNKMEVEINIPNSNKENIKKKKVLKNLK